MITDLASGKSMSLATVPVPDQYFGSLAPRISPDGARVTFFTREGGKDTGFLVPAGGGMTRKICDCTIRHWAADNRRLLITKGRDTGLLDLESGQFDIIAQANAAPRTSWDDKWLAFYNPTPVGTTRMWIAPVRPGPPTVEKEWIPLNDGSSYDVIPEFSPDGSRIYYLSQRDGARCLWVQKLDAATKKTRGQARARLPLPQRPPLAHLQSLRAERRLGRPQ
jgi:Tol biopolymer transport system component